MLENSGKPAPSAQRTIDQYFDVSKNEEVKEFIISLRNPGRMVYYDFEEYDTQDEKDALWGGY